MVSNEHERDNIYLLYSAASSPLLFSVPLSDRYWLNPVDLKKNR